MYIWIVYCVMCTSKCEGIFVRSLQPDSDIHDFHGPIMFQHSTQPEPEREAGDERGSLLEVSCKEVHDPA